ncbi:golgi associated, gamma adaptin ear containing, ARF binding protein 2 [Homo sapiens]|uniref:Golgi associated, gamma adaptin ear containing, ARF binding protein 2 n=1 Tax=Homo sapiens TaxID=9606 RepID=H3BPF4_HUMAN|nr:golgi associated, gamma adaptin ear containing, ARF binding protein 2 [Homo sapiens]KAI4054075.1 golgi associated, gamma adaptin ear containing, ARF binding protein 2 [Homo sapiens]
MAATAVAAAVAGTESAQGPPGPAASLELWLSDHRPKHVGTGLVSYPEFL